jgi:hypothetical protein
MTKFRLAEVRLARLIPNHIRFDAVVASYDAIIGAHAPGLANVGVLEVRLVPGLRARVHGCREALSCAGRSASCSDPTSPTSGPPPHTPTVTASPSLWEDRCLARNLDKHQDSAAEHHVPLPPATVVIYLPLSGDYLGTQLPAPTTRDMHPIPWNSKPPPPPRLAWLS